MEFLSLNLICSRIFFFFLSVRLCFIFLQERFQELSRVILLIQYKIFYLVTPNDKKYSAYIEDIIPWP